jgi:hypothetical protein
MKSLDLKALAALKADLPSGLMARIRLAWPEIKAALERGHTLKAVHECLREAGVEIAYATLSGYLSILRREENTGELPRRPAEKTRRQATPGARDASTETGVPPKEHETKPTDALADFQQRISRRTVFEFKPGPPDESKLI